MENTSLDKHCIALEFDKVLFSLSKFAKSSLGKQKCLNIELNSNILKIEYELDLVQEARNIIDDTSKNVPIDKILDAQHLLNSSRLSIKEIYELALDLKTARETKTFIQKHKDSSKLCEICQNLYINKDFEDYIFEIFDNELNMKDCASDKLKSLRMSYKDNKENLKEAIDKLLANSAFQSYLQDNVVSTRDLRPVFQVKASCKNKVSGIVHDVSSTSLTYFIEPASLIPLSNKLRQIEFEINAEIERILSDISTQFNNMKNELVQNQNLLARLDFIFAKANYAIHLHAQRPEITQEKIIDIQQMAHPLLLDIKNDVVKNDFVLGKNYNCILITGSNTGGKTVALKTAGLMVLMTKAGLFISALGAKIHPYKNVFCDIAEEQNLEQGISTYSAHIKNISQILDNIDDDSLVLFDELGSGTDPVESQAISCAILEYIASKNTHGIITTHLGQLKALKYKNPYFENATVLFDINEMKPKYNLIIGASGTSNAIDISSQLGLNFQIIARSREILKEENSDTSKLFFEMEKTNQILSKKEEELSKNLSDSLKTKDELEQKLDDIKKNKKKSLDNFKKKFQNTLDDARSEIKEAVDEIRKQKSLKVAMRSYDRLNKIENAIREQFSIHDDELSEKYKSLDINSLKIGQNVLVKKLNQVVILDTLPDKKGNVIVRIGNIKSKVKVSELAYTDKKVAQHLKKIKVTFDNDYNLLSTLDLRGMRVIEAIEYLDDKLDKASLRGLNQVTIIHGYGTGALKSAVCDYLKNSPYVSKFRYLENSQKNEGAVVADLY